MNLETKIKQKLLDRGFSNETLLNNRGLIGATIDETAKAKSHIPIDILDFLHTIASSDERMYRESARGLYRKYKNND